MDSIKDTKEGIYENMKLVSGGSRRTVEQAVGGRRTLKGYA